MTSELFQEIKSRLSLPNPNKAAIARETGASVVQVRKVATGGYDKKFAEEQSSNSSISSSSVSIPKADLPELSASKIPALDDLPQTAPPSFGEEMAGSEPPLTPPPAPSFKLPIVPPSQALPSPPQPEISATKAPSLDDLPLIAPPSFGEEIADEPSPLAPPSAPEPADAPLSPPSGKTQPPTSRSEGGPVKPSLSPKPKSVSGGKPSLSIKTGKKKPMGLKITRPPMRPPSS